MIKTDVTTLVDTVAVELDGEEECEVPIHDL